MDKINNAWFLLFLAGNNYWAYNTTMGIGYKLPMRLGR